MKTPTILLVLLVGLTPILLISLLVFGSTLTIFAWQPPTVWSNQFGLPEPDVSNGATSVFASSNSLYAGGYLGYTNIVTNTTGTLFVNRYDMSGHQVWTRQFGDPTVSEIVAVAAGSGGVSVAGTLDRGFVRYYDVNGTEVWTSELSTSQGRMYDVSVGQSAVYAAGYNYFANNSQVEVLQAYDFKGNNVWTSRIDPPHGDQGLNVNIYTDSDGIYVSKSERGFGMGFLQLYHFNGTLKWARQLNCSSCSTTGVSGDGTEVYLAGYVNPLGQNLFFLNRYDSAGTQIWTRQFSPYVSGASNIGISADSSGIYMAIAGLNGGGRS